MNENLNNNKNKIRGACANLMLPWLLALCLHGVVAMVVQICVNGWR